MEYLAGRNLEQEAHARGGVLPPSEVSSILSEILHGLTVVHQKKVLHRDLKPSNIMVSSQRIVLIDFGAARVYTSRRTTTALPITWQYAALEQIVGGQKSDATDLFAVGAIGWRLLTGSPPPYALARHEGTELKSLARIVPAASTGLVHAIEWALELNASRRPQSAGEMVDAIEGRRHAAAEARTAVKRRVPRQGFRPMPPGERIRQVRRATERARRHSKQPSPEALRLAGKARWPLAALLASPALIVPLRAAVAYLCLVLVYAAALAARSLGREARSAPPLTPARAVFLLPRMVTRAFGYTLEKLWTLLGGALVLVVYVGVGALVAAACAAANVIAQDEHLDHLTFATQFNATFPRAAVTVPIFLMSFKAANHSLVRQAVMRTTAATEAPIVGLWCAGLAVPLLLALSLPCHPWSPFRGPEQALSWVDDRIPFIRDLDNAIAKALIKQQILDVMHCRDLSQSYGSSVSEIGKRSFTVTVDLNRQRVERDAAGLTSSAGSTNAAWQVALVTAVLGGLDHSLIARVRAITVNEVALITLPDNRVQTGAGILALHLSRPNGRVLAENASLGAAIRAAHVLYADQARGHALEQTLPDMSAPAATALCG